MVFAFHAKTLSKFEEKVCGGQNLRGKEQNLNSVLYLEQLYASEEKIIFKKKKKSQQSV